MFCIKLFYDARQILPRVFLFIFFSRPLDKMKNTYYHMNNHSYLIAQTEAFQVLRGQ